MLKLHNIDFHADIYEDLKRFIKEGKQIETSQKGVHFGNYCLVNIPDDLLQEIKTRFKEDIKGWQYRNCKTILENEDLQDFQYRDKITIEYLETDFFPVTNAKGTIYNIKKYNIYDTKRITLTIRAYRSKTKGWHISAGDNCRIRKGW